MKKNIIIVAALMIVCVNSRVYADKGLESAAITFQRGNSHYAAGNFPQAIENYQKALDAGYESGPLYYNLANAYVKQGMLGKAKVNYLRAKRLMPRDADLNSNLAYVNSLLSAENLSEEKGLAAGVLSRLANLFDIDRIAAATAGAYWLFALFFILYLLGRKSRKIYGSIAALCCAGLVVCAILFCLTVNRVVVEKEAVVVVSETDSKFEPFDAATTFFGLREGQEIFVLAKKDSWVKIRRADGKQGWVKAKDIEVL